MQHYNYQQQLKEIWTQAVARYEAGHRQAAGFLDAATVTELAQLGLTIMDVFDYAEDYVSGGEPDFETFLLVHAVRRDYFRHQQGGRHSEQRLDPTSLPAKSDAVRGIAWLPRILPKAIAKLRGELPPEIMYGCGGDRRFFKTHNIHPAEFLRITWAYENEPERIIDWVEARRAAPASKTLP